MSLGGSSESNSADDKDKDTKSPMKVRFSSDIKNHMEPDNT